jgi:phospholipase D1/2
LATSVVELEGEAGTRRRDILRIVAALGLLLALAATWKWTPLGDAVRPSELSETLGPRRYAWYMFPLTIAAFSLLGFLMVPVMGMVLTCGLVFGPWLGTLYALVGSLASAAAGFGAGRKLGRRSLERLLGPRVRKLTQRVAEDGVLAVYVIRKIPMPFTLVNMAIGASTIRFPDFLAGTALGMSPFVVVLSVGGAKLPELLADPSPRAIALVAATFLLPVPVAFALDVALKRRRRRTSA